MLFIAILAAISCVALCAPPACQTKPTGCNTDEFKSFPFTDAMKARGKGRQAMKTLITLKNKAYADREHCKSTGQCPQLMPPASVTKARVDCVDGMAGIYPCRNVDMLSFLNFTELGYNAAGVMGNDLWVWHDPETNDDYVIMGLNDGSSFVRVTDRVNPEVVGILPTHTSRSSWRDMKVVGNYAFIVSEASGHGMQVFDMTQLRSLSADNTRVFNSTVHYGIVSNTHNIVANEVNNRVFLVGSTFGPVPEICDGGLHIVDVSNPLEPTLMSCFGGDGYVHDAQCIIYDGPDTRYTGKEICFCYNEDTFTIVDTTVPAEATVLGRKGYEGNAYSHQGWNTVDNTFALLDDELDELVSSNKNTSTFVWDITDLTDPILVNTHRAPQESSDHNMYIKGNYAHQSNYMSGYRLLTLNDLPNLSEVAYFDVYPDATQAGFDGTWSNYPYFEDNAVAVSSITYGLFMLQPDFAAIEACGKTSSQTC